MARTNRTRFVVLGLLTEAPKTGYQLKQEIDEVIGHFWQESYGQIYPVLKELWESGLAERMSDPAGGRKRYVYSITEAGETELARWLEEAPEPQVTRHELLLKLFFGSSTTPAVLREHVTAFLERTRRLAAFLEQVKTDIETETAPQVAYWRLTVRAGEKVSRARAEWAEEVLAELDELERRAESPSRERGTDGGEDES